MDPFIGTVIQFGGNFAPRGWALCDGQLLSISSHSALFSILGTTYGGDGVSTFALPDLRGRAAVHPGNGPGLAPHNLGQKWGEESFTLSTNNMPAHAHTLNARSQGAGTTVPTDNVLAAANTYAKRGIDTELDATSIGNSGEGQAVNHVPPALGLNFIIALEGIFPSRS